MQLVSSMQVVEDVAEKIKQLIEEKNVPENKITVVTKKDHEQEIKNLTKVKIETVGEEDIRFTDYTEQYHLNETSASIFSDALQRGGYVILLDKPEQDIPDRVEKTGKEAAREDEDEKGDFEQAIDDHLSAPGFGVDFKDPGTDAEMHKDAIFKNEDESDRS